jgi:hypothetical protein
LDNGILSHIVNSVEVVGLGDIEHCDEVEIVADGWVG